MQSCLHYMPLDTLYAFPLTTLFPQTCGTLPVSFPHALSTGLRGPCAPLIPFIPSPPAFALPQSLFLPLQWILYAHCDVPEKAITRPL
jgi:hypothetical protein